MASKKNLTLKEATARIHKIIKQVASTESLVSKENTKNKV